MHRQNNHGLLDFIEGKLRVYRRKDILWKNEKQMYIGAIIQIEN